MDPLTKVRIELLDEDTGTPITEVDAITSSEVIMYTNSTPMPANVGSLDKGTTFDNVSLKTILDGILYSYAIPTIKEITIDNSDFSNTVINNTTITKQKHSTVPSFAYTVSVDNGTSNMLSCVLKVYKSDSTVEQQTAQVNTEIGKSYNFTFNISEITMDSTIEVTISDGINSITGPYVYYKFADPIYVGFASPDIMTDYNELIPDNMDRIVSYFEGIIENPSEGYIETRYSDIADQNAIFYKDISAEERVKLNPFILVPVQWGNPLAIIDSNNLNIIKSFSFISDVALNVYEDEVVSYILYMHRGSFNIDSSYIGRIKYCFTQPSDGTMYPDVDEMSGNGVQITSPFDIQYDAPIDTRFTVKTYEDLIKMSYPYNGLITYVEEIDTFFRYNENKGGWLPTCTKVWVIDDTAQLTENLGGWDDVAIETDGTIYRKRYNNIWEIWGNIGGGGSGGYAYPQIRFNEEYDPEKLYLNNDSVFDVVYYNGTTYYCKQNCMGVTPYNDGIHWSYFAKGCFCSGLRGVAFKDINTGETLSIDDILAENIAIENVAIDYRK